jgi:hypothetical protein
MARAIAALALVGQAQAQDHGHAGSGYDLGGKFDKSFNEAAFNGAERFKAETGVEYREFEFRTNPSASRPLRNFRAPRLQPDHRDELQPGSAADQGRRRVPGHQVRHCRRGGRPAERPLNRVQGA